MDLGETLRKEKLKDEKRIPKNGKLIHKGFEYCNGSFIIMMAHYSKHVEISFDIYSIYFFMVMKLYDSSNKSIEVPLYFKTV